MRRLLILPLVVLAISGCQRPFTLFRLQIDDRSGSREVGLTERPGRPPGEEGLLARAGEPLVLIPSSSVSIDSAAHLLVRLSAPARDLTVTIRDDDGEVVAQQRPFALFPPAADEVGAADEAEGAAGGADEPRCREGHLSGLGRRTGARGSQRK